VINTQVVSITGTTVLGDLKSLGNTIVVITNNMIQQDLNVIDSNDVTVTGNTIGQDLEIIGTTGLICDDTNNMITGITDPCP